jgi:hypothetical protein
MKSSKETLFKIIRTLEKEIVRKDKIIEELIAENFALRNHLHDQKPKCA